MSVVTCTPKKENKIAELFSLCLFIGAIALWYTAQMDTPFRWILQMFSLLSAMACLLFLIRFGMTSFTLILEEDDLIVKKTVGRRTVVFCDLTLKMARGLHPIEKGKDPAARYGKISARYNCCVNLMPKKPYLLIFAFGGKTSSMVLQADDAFLVEMQRRIVYYRGLSEDEDDENTDFE